ncbi:hypothetical protein [Sphingobacterium suaedae]|uniref:Uncharacterized protein n=1 Tax=Sphingobacterium suaedae TaxID=1686402 RepID=A0ABW5KE73_9SPHI
MVKYTSFLVTLAVVSGACSSTKHAAGLLRDCPEEKIVNKMPIAGHNGSESRPASYFIYKGERRELTEFDLEWVKKNCSVKETVVY